MNCGYKLFHRRVIQEMAFESIGAFITVEFLVKLKKAGLRFEEVGVHHYPRLSGKSTGAKPGVIAKAFRDLFVLWAELRGGRDGLGPRAPGLRGR
jgi:hypothetical protein